MTKKSRQKNEPKNEVF